MLTTDRAGAVAGLSSSAPVQNVQLVPNRPWRQAGLAPCRWWCKRALVSNVGHGAPNQCRRRKTRRSFFDLRASIQQGCATGLAFLVGLPNRPDPLPHPSCPDQSRATRDNATVSGSARGRQSADHGREGGTVGMEHGQRSPWKPTESTRMYATTSAHARRR
jgi:hypothetical protein